MKQQRFLGNTKLDTRLSDCPRTCKVSARGRYKEVTVLNKDDAAAETLRVQGIGITCTELYLKVYSAFVSPIY